MYDPGLEKLFASSIGPARIRGEGASQPTVTQTVNPVRSPKESSADYYTSKEPLAAELLGTKDGYEKKARDRKRKRVDIDDDDVEGRYIRSLLLGQARDEGRHAATSQLSQPLRERTAQSRHHSKSLGNLASNGVMAEEKEDVESVRGEPLQHETVLRGTTLDELEKSSRTVFLANVSTSAIKSKISKKTLMDHLASFIPSLPPSNVQHAIESLRFRSTAFVDSGIPRKAAFIKKDLMESTTRSTNAYAIYTTHVAAREAMTRLNGTVVLDRHLRVDSVAHPAKQDHRRCVFVGNLGFVDDTTAIDEARNEGFQSKRQKKKVPADVEEGLWRQFGNAGNVESVRVVRDKITRVGKGFAYVQFHEANAVERALLLNDRKFPPMLPRTLRVTRAKNFTKAKFTNDDIGKRPARDQGARKGSRFAAEMPSQEAKSLLGRAKKVLGRAGTAHCKRMPASTDRKKLMTKNSKKRAENYKRNGRQ